jgi:two-component system response regulator NreC
MDISLGAEKLDGIKGVKIAREACPEVAVLILSMHDDYELLVEAARAGASGYLVKACTSEELVAAIRAVASGGGWLSPMMARKAMDLLAGAASVHAGQEKRDVASGRLGLTEREQEILGMIARGYKYQEIGEALFISTSQVKQIARRICEKIGARDKAHAAAIAVADGLVAPSQLTSQAGEAVSTGLLS